MAISYQQDVIRKPVAWPYVIEDLSGKTGALNASFWDVTETTAGGITGTVFTDEYVADLTSDPDTDKMAEVIVDQTANPDQGTANIDATTVNEIPPGMNFYFWTYVRAQPNETPNTCSGTVRLKGTGTTTVHTINRVDSGTAGNQDSGAIKGLCMGFYAGSNQWRVYGPDIAGALVTGNPGIKVSIYASFFENASNQVGIATVGVGNINYGK